MLRCDSKIKTVVLVALLGAGSIALVGSSRGAARAAAQEGGYRVVENWPQWPAGIKYEYASGVGVDAKGIVYGFIRDTDEKAGKGGTGSIHRFDRSGKYLGKWGPSDFVTPHSLHIDRQGNVWTTDRDGQQIRKFSQDGKELLTVGKRRVWGKTGETFNGPTGIAFLPNGDFVVSDGYWNSRLAWFDKDGRYLREAGKFGRGPGEFGNPHSVALAPGGRLLVADLCPALHQDAVSPGQIADYLLAKVPGCEKITSRIQVVDKDGKHVAFWPTPGFNPLSVTVVGDRAYVGEFSGKNVHVLDANTGKPIQTIEGAVSAHGHQIAVDGRTGDIYTASVYPEHAKFPRGVAGRTLRRLTRDAQ